MNNLGGVYTTGTITIAVGGVSVTGVGTLWTPIAEIGDWILCNGQVGLILTVNGDTLLTLQTPWQGTLPSGATYVLIKMSWLRYEPALMQAKLRELLAELEGAGNFVFTSVDPPDPAIGQDGDFALKADVTPWQIWVKTGGVWVEQAPPGAVIVDDQVTPPMLDADTAAKQVAFRVRLDAAPFDAMAYNGMQINGSMDVSQEFGTDGTTIPMLAAGAAGGKNVLDGWRIDFVGGGTGSNFVCHNTASADALAIQKCLQVYCDTHGFVVGTDDSIVIRQPVEGYRTARLAFGTASTQSITIGFFARSAISGQMGVTLRNFAGARTITKNVTLAVGWNYKTLTFPGDTTGTWNISNGVGVFIDFCLAAGASKLVSPDVWSGSNGFGSVGQSNFLVNSGMVFQITGVVILPGTQAPTAAQSPLIMRPYDQELLTCQRYLSGVSSFGATGYTASATLARHGITFPVLMRAAPTLVLKDPLMMSTNTPTQNAKTGSATIAYLSGADYVPSVGGCVLDVNYPGATFTIGQACATKFNAGALLFDARL